MRRKGIAPFAAILFLLVAAYFLSAEVSMQAETPECADTSNCSGVPVMQSNPVSSAELDSCKAEYSQLVEKVNEQAQRTCSGSFISSSNHDNVGTYSCYNSGERTTCTLEFSKEILITSPDYGTSMYPALSVGDHVMIAPWLEPVKGDFVYARIGGSAEIHQVVDIQNGKYILKGLNNPTTDFPLASRSDITGVVVTRLIGFMER